ncbi:hypothetical protein AMTR_s00002p00237460 [Amborella trichopoda]|uniref:GDT1 family protein n=1 Tax=Amborella trichopoda TaxID=13333 RepID=W1P0R7_AMBTC|nr:hypothetical protein AMTR_s00002p00237460 [Amborella trichopoda]
MQAARVRTAVRMMVGAFLMVGAAVTVIAILMAKIPHFPMKLGFILIGVLRMIAAAFWIRYYYVTLFPTVDVPPPIVNDGL